MPAVVGVIVDPFREPGPGRPHPDGRNGYPDPKSRAGNPGQATEQARQKAGIRIRPVRLPVRKPDQKERPRTRRWIDAKLAFRGISPGLTTRINV